MKWLLIIIGTVVCLIVVVVLIGYLLPVRHKSTVQVLISAGPDQVWQRLIDFRNYPNWRKDIRNVEVKSDNQWIEVNSQNQRLPFKIMVSEEMRRLVTQIDATGLPFGGNWEFNLTPKDSGTLLSITENGEVYNPIFRFVSRFIIGHASAQKKFAAYLEKSFN